MEIVYIIAPNIELAEQIAVDLVKNNLVACANLFNNVTSIYKWQGNLQKETEVVIIAKTLESKVGDIINSVTAMHSYDCPLIFSVSTSNVNNSFLEWVHSSIGM